MLQIDLSLMKSGESLFLNLVLSGPWSDIYIPKVKEGSYKDEKPEGLWIVADQLIKISKNNKLLFT